MRKRAEWLTHIHNPSSQDHLPESGKNIADKVNRTGVAARVPEPAVQNSMAVDRALIDHDDHLLRAMALTLLKRPRRTIPTRSTFLRTVPRIGALLSLVRAQEPVSLLLRALRVDWAPASAPEHLGLVTTRWTWTAPPSAPGPHGRA